LGSIPPTLGSLARLPDRHRGQTGKRDGGIHARHRRDICFAFSFVIRDAERRFLYAIRALEDVTERRRAEAEQRV
jgi:hypothetical protein